MLQSSFGTIAILITLAGSVAGASLIPLSHSAYIIYGANIGTCLTALIAAIPGSNDSKRVALFHLMFNVVGVVVFSLLMLTPWLSWLEAGVTDPTMQIILVNIIFKTVIAIMFMPFLASIAKLFNKFYSKSKNKKPEVFSLDSDIVQIPTIAIKQINYAVLKSFTNFKDYLYSLDIFLKTPARNILDTMLKKRDELTRWNNSISSQAIRLSGNLSELDTQNITLAINVMSNYNRAIDYVFEILIGIDIKNANMALTAKQREVVADLCREVINILNANIEMFDHIYKEDKHFDYSVITLSVLDCSEYISKMKNDQKKEIVAENYSKEDKLVRNSSYLNIVNLFDSIGVELADATVNITNFKK
jgi:phosphate:Na+ symporter